MDIVALDASKNELGICADFINITEAYIYTENKFIYKMQIRYTDKNWILFRDASYFKDNEVPEVLVSIDKVDVAVDTIIVYGNWGARSVLESWIR